MRQLAARFHTPTTASTIDKLEKGKMTLTQEWMYRLAEALDVHPVELIQVLPRLAPEEERLIEVFRQSMPKLTHEEQQLLSRFRRIDEDGRDAVFRILDQMVAVPKDLVAG